ncbi:uncharacterized protein LOC108037242 [Drosophila rhopaloa]|uniref:Uncharacterized protein LOC108037242 n=1 Tax=Drosophila rhopaloa TaxID=1041015 RepID=A0A6P4DYU8_DRORH|nr:uncharacterized protein LOC108037242 [Drosophila rhopaloa]
MALADESNYTYVKQVALDWRELVREKRQTMTLSPTISMLAEESQLRMAEPKSRTQSMIPAERRDSSFYRHRFSQQPKEPIEIEHREGSMEASRIRVNDDVQLYIYQPIRVTDSVRASVHAMSPSDISMTSTKLEDPINLANPVPLPEPKSP